jgi:hypothetical protein
MTSPPFDAAKALTFDLSRGQILDGGAGARVLVPAAGLLALCGAAPKDSLAAFGRALGESIGGAVARRFERAGVTAVTASVDEVANYLGGELAVAGFGVLAIERWGRALVLVIDNGPDHANSDKVLALLLASAVSRATGLDTECVRLARDGQSSRFLVTSRAAAEQVGEWIDAGTPWAEALARLHAKHNAPEPV